jgi:hypothetical protein
MHLLSVEFVPFRHDLYYGVERMIFGDVKVGDDAFVLIEALGFEILSWKNFVRSFPVARDHDCGRHVQLEWCHGLYEWKACDGRYIIVAALGSRQAPESRNPGCYVAAATAS